MLKITPHPIGGLGCNPSLHCHSHNLDEPAAPAYVICFECGHVFPSAFRLWWRNLTLAFRLARADRRPGFVLYALLTDPNRISSCTECAHDF